MCSLLFLDLVNNQPVYKLIFVGDQ